MLQSKRPKEIMSRRQILEDGITRLSRLLEAELASAHSQDVPRPNAQVRTGFEALLAQDDAIAPTIFQPYQELSKGVRVGYESHDGNVWAVLDFKPGHREEISQNEVVTRSPKLGVHPVFPGGRRSKWMTLEANVEMFEIEGLNGLEVSLLADFSFLDPLRSMHTNVIKVSIRCEYQAAPFKDFDVGFFPVTSVPTAHSLFFEDLESLGAAFQSCSALKVIIWMPALGNYRLNLYDFSMALA